LHVGPTTTNFFGENIQAFLQQSFRKKLWFPEM